eukprot:m.489590 g.489590  ORF g.489590 m.489590 type:complete len:673 (-) comp26904_c0_seq1:368-2386(-)
MASAPYLALSEPGVAAADVVLPHAKATQNAHVSSLAEYNRMYTRSLEDPEGFWGDIAKQFHWESPWDEFHFKNFSKKAGKVEARWFKGGKTNICYNAVDRHVAAGLGDKVAFYFEGNDPSDKSTMTYSQLLARVQRVANTLSSLGLKKGDTVALYMPMVLDLVVAMLASARLGLVHSIVFGGFSAEALADRILDAKSRVLITADGVFRGTKLINLKAIADAACERCAQRDFEVEHVVCTRNLGDKLGQPLSWKAPRDKWFHELEAQADIECPPVWVDAEDPLFLLYTSGSTGTPKGVLHTTGGYMVWTATTFKYSFDYHQDDVYWCTADIGWITGHSYIAYGPLLNSATSVYFEGVPTFPDAGRFWKIVEEYKVNQFYTAPTAIRALMRFGNEFPEKYDLSSLRVLGTVGEPINKEAWVWYHEVIGKKQCSIVDTWWQTETGGHMLTGLPGATPMKPGAASLPMFGIQPAVVDQQAKELDGACEGYLVFKGSWPGQFRTIFGNQERYETGYFGQFDGYYCCGDGCKRDEHGYYWITGRTDDVLNVSGHRLGTAELENALAKHTDVVEAAIVAIPHDIKGMAVHAFVIAKAGVTDSPEVQKDMKLKVRTEIGPFATPDVIQIVPGLPKTRSGKIMRRVLRKIACYEEDGLGDLSTLADPTVIDQLLETRPAKP